MPGFFIVIPLPEGIKEEIAKLKKFYNFLHFESFKMPFQDNQV